MNVFEFVHLTYCWEDNDYDLASSEIFETYEDAITYYEIIKEKIILEYFNEASVSNLKEFENDDFCYYNESEYLRSEPDCNAKNESFMAHYKVQYPCMYISIDEYGSETLMIKKRAIMRFS